MIKIAFVINYIVNNGPGNVILNIINNLDQNTYDMTLITLFSGNDPEIIRKLKENNIGIYECKSLSRLKCILGASEEFNETAAQNKFDIIHSHGLVPDILSGRLKNNAVKISTLHNNMFEDYYETYGAIKSSVLVKLHLHYLKKINNCVCCSESVYNIMKKHLEKISYVRNGITIPQSNADRIEREKLNLPENATVFIFVGSLNKRKNTEWLIEQFVKCRNNDEFLLILGDGYARKSCEDHADSHVRLIGFKSNPMPYYQISNIYISASISEGFSVSVLEALSAGLGLMLSAIPAHSELFKIDDSIYLGENFLPSEFEAKMNVLRKKYGKISGEKIAEFHRKFLSGESMTNQYSSIYQKAVRLTGSAQ